MALCGDTPGPVGMNDYAEPATCYVEPVSDDTEGVCYLSAPTEQDEWTPIISGTIPVGRGLHIALSPAGYVPKSGSTSTLFIQDVTGKRHLRLDYGYNKSTGHVDYHWNQKGTYPNFGITDHTPTGNSGKVLYQGAKYFKYAGRTLMVVGAVMDIYSIVVAKKRLRQVLRVAGGWAGAWAGCQVVGAGGAALGSVEPGGGTAVGGVLGCVIGGIGGYAGASWAVGEAYDWVEETFFEQVPESMPE
jgi:hypothetical protein